MPDQIIRFDPADPALGWSGIDIEGPDVLPSTGNQLGLVLTTKGGFTCGTCDLYVTQGDVTLSVSRFDSSGGSSVCLDAGAALDMAATLLTGNGGKGQPALGIMAEDRTPQADATCVERFGERQMSPNLLPHNGMDQRA